VLAPLSSLTLGAGLAALLAFGVGGVAYFYFEGLGAKGRVLAALRGSAGTLLGLLLLDLTCARPESARRPLVLLDGSLSMTAAGGAVAASDSAAVWGEVRHFGAAPTGPDSAPRFGRSTLLPALLAATALDRPVIVVTDGAIDDDRDLPPDLLARASVKLFPRAEIADAAVLRVEGPDRLTLGDTLRVEAEIGRFGGAGEAATVELTGPGNARLLLREVKLGPAGGRVSLALSSRSLGAGDHLLTVRVRVAGDAEPHDDARQLLVRITPLPGAVLLAAPPDWDARQLYATLRDVAALPVKGYIRVGATGWRSMDDLRRVPVDEVRRAARGADLLVLKGEPGEVAWGARPRGVWRWPSGEGGETQLDGDWYAVPANGPSPLGGAWIGVAVDSLPPLARVTPIEPDPRGWVGLSAQLGRRGVERPIIVGRDSSGIRTLLVASDGLWRWAFKPGSGEEAYRQLIAASANWLLGATDTLQGAALPIRRVVPLGYPVVFAWRLPGPARPVAVTLTGDSGTRQDTLHFDGAGHAELRLGPGRYVYQLLGGGRGVVAVEPWSAEYLPRPAVLKAQAVPIGAGSLRTALRDQTWIYFVVVLLLCGEWWVRRRMGLR
jgi:hypothetical protein